MGAVSTSKGFAEDDISENNPDDISMEEISEFELLFGVRVLLHEHINIASINVSIKATVFLSENTLIPLYYVLMVFLLNFKSTIKYFIPFARIVMTNDFIV